MHDLFKIPSSVLMKNWFSLGMGLVKLSGSWLDDITNSSTHPYFSTRFLIKWCINLMCCTESEEYGFLRGL